MRGKGRREQVSLHRRGRRRTQLGDGLLPTAYSPKDHCLPNHHVAATGGEGKKGEGSQPVIARCAFLFRRKRGGEEEMDLAHRLPTHDSRGAALTPLGGSLCIFFRSLTSLRRAVVLIL